MNTAPPVSESRPARQCSSVDLPEPEGPMIAVKRPGSNVDRHSVESVHHGLAAAVGLASVGGGRGGGESRRGGGRGKAHVTCLLHEGAGRIPPADDSPSTDRTISQPPERFSRRLGRSQSPTATTLAARWTATRARNQSRTALGSVPRAALRRSPSTNDSSTRNVAWSRSCSPISSVSRRWPSIAIPSRSSAWSSACSSSSSP